MMERSGRNDTRDRILQGSTHLVQEDGPGALTLDAVVRRVGISKGGLLYHFPSKDALAEGVLLKLCADFDALLELHLAAEPPAPGRWLRAYLRATFAEESPPLEVCLHLSSALASSPALQNQLESFLSRWAASAAADGLPPARATLLRHAADGYWVERMLRPEGMSADEREALLQELLSLTTKDS